MTRPVIWIPDFGARSSAKALVCCLLAASLFPGFRSFAGPAAPALQAPVLVAETTSAGSISLQEENPTFAVKGRDRHYTNGLTLSYTTPQLKSGSLLDAPIQFLENSTFLFNRSTSGADDRFGWTVLGQTISTPQDHDARNPSPNDRPYAAWLYTGGSFIQNTDNQVLTSLGFQLGVVGPWALGKQVQNNYHRFTGAESARGWDHQLSNQFGFTTSWERRWRLYHDLGNAYGWELIPNVSVVLGNVFTYADAGALIRWGRGLKSNWGPNLIKPGYSGANYFAAEEAGTDWGFDIYGGITGRVVAVNIFLDGNTFQDSRSVDKEFVVADAMAGAEIFYKDRFRFGFSFLARTPEFRQQRGPDTYGAFNLAFGL
jgi:lipid A 3-O-deacylase